MREEQRCRGSAKKSRDMERQGINQKRVDLMRRQYRKCEVQIEHAY